MVKTYLLVYSIGCRKGCEVCGMAIAIDGSVRSAYAMLWFHGVARVWLLQGREVYESLQ